jgi:cytochrome c-type biogenesis protein CcmH
MAGQPCGRFLFLTYLTVGKFRREAPAPLLPHPRRDTIPNTEGEVRAPLMLFWFLCAVMTAAVVYAVTRPLMAARTGTRNPGAADLAVYRDQLKEIEADRARGVLGSAEAEAARVEISRRLLACADAQQRPAALAAAPGAAKIVLAAVTAGVPLAALALYLAFGSPGLPDQPSAPQERLALEKASVAQLVAQVEARLRERPEDGKGWDVIAPVYLAQERYQEAAQAFAKAIRLLGESTKRLAGFAEATVLANNGVVSEEARQAYEKILRLEPGRLEPRFWLALAKEQDGDLARAARDYESLLAEAPADAAWRGAVEERLRLVRGRLAAGNVPSAAGPTAEDVAAADKLPAEDRARMIRQMVEGLAARLRADGKDLAGWQRLLRVYAVLGEKDEALRALAEARKAFAGDSAALSQLDALAASLGLGS